MTLEELGRELPNGFHDAEIRSLAVDYAKREMTLELALWVGDLEEKLAPREAYREGLLRIDGLEFFSVDPPDGTQPMTGYNSLWIDLDTRSVESARVAATKVGAACFVSRFFVHELNGWITMAGGSASLSWTGEMYDRDARG